MTRPAKTDRPPSIAITHLGGMGGVSIPGGSTAGGIPAGGTAGQVLTAGGSNGERYWGPNVRQITANSSNIATGPDVNFSAGSNIILAVTSNTIIIASTAVGGSSTDFLTKIEGGQDTIKVHGSTGSTETFDPTDGNVHTATLDANCTFTLNAPVGSGAATIELYLTQDGTGSRLVTWPGSVVWPGGTAPTLTTTAAAVDRILLETLNGGTTWYGVMVGSGAGGTTITTKDEGSTLSSTVTTLDFVGAGVTASGGGATTTVTISGGGGGSMVWLQRQTASASAQLDFTSFISSTYETYVFELNNIYPATNDVGLRMRAGTGGGPTYDTGTNYAWAVFIWRAGGSASNGVESASDYMSLNYGAGGTLGVSNTASYNGYSGRVTLYNPSSAVYKNFRSAGQYLDAESFRIGVDGRGSYESTTAITAVRFYFSSGNITSGTIDVYGLTKA